MLGCLQQLMATQKSELLGSENLIFYNLIITNSDEV